MAALRARLTALLADPTPRTAEELDLAEAVCALRWPNWPPYEGPLDIFEVQDALAKLPPVHIDTIHRLAAQPDYGPGLTRFRAAYRARGP
jgi:hypothetical protein